MLTPYKSRAPIDPLSQRQESGLKPESCPSCSSKAVGTLAKVITIDTYWRCQGCGESGIRDEWSAPDRPAQPLLVGSVAAGREAGQWFVPSAISSQSSSSSI